MAEVRYSSHTKPRHGGVVSLSSADPSAWTCSPLKCSPLGLLPPKHFCPLLTLLAGYRGQSLAQGHTARVALGSHDSSQTPPTASFFWPRQKQNHQSCLPQESPHLWNTHVHTCAPAPTRLARPSLWHSVSHCSLTQAPSPCKLQGSCHENRVRDPISRNPYEQKQAHRP